LGRSRASHLGNPNSKPYGNGVVLWFQTDRIDKAFKRAQDHGGEVIETLKVNPGANHREFWLRDPDGYVVMIAGSYGDLGE
jgi:predicted enzyme related to lactoylglutathione lyase